MTTSEAVEPDAAFAQLAQINLSDQSLPETLRQIAELAKRMIDGVDETSITVTTQGRPKTMVFTNALAVQLDERQYESGFGPCLDAATTGATIVLNHRDDYPLYPEFTRAALRAGILHTAAVALVVPHRTAGALNLYAAGEEPFTRKAVTFAERFASYAAYAVSNADRIDNAEELARQLQEAMRSRAVIEQAKGIVMAHQGVSADDAFRRLAKQSQDTNTRLRELAARIVAHPTEAG
jgi:transcriptional regulator with GAF, ATPase, and Fis domain